MYRRGMNQYPIYIESTRKLTFIITAAIHTLLPSPLPSVSPDQKVGIPEAATYIHQVCPPISDVCALPIPISWNDLYLLSSFDELLLFRPISNVIFLEMVLMFPFHDL